MIEIGNLFVKDKFQYKDFTYQIIEINTVFVICKRIPDNGITRYFLKSILVNPEVKVKFWVKNPDYDITDRYNR